MPSVVPIPADPAPRTWAGVSLGAAPSIDPSASGLVGYVSPNTGQDQNQTPPDQAAIDELARLRGWSEKDEAFHKILSWTTRKDYPTHIGISLEIQDQVGKNTHEIQFWEKATFLPPIGSGAELYNWLVETIRERSRTSSLPRGMPETFEGIEVHAQRWGNGGYIKFTHQDNLAASMDNQPNIVQLVYGTGYGMFGMSDMYTIGMLAGEFLALIGPDYWSIYPSVSYERLTDATVVHQTVTDWREIEGLITYDIMLDLRERKSICVRISSECWTTGPRQIHLHRSVFHCWWGITRSSIGSR
jgi:hypothetical protein